MSGLVISKQGDSMNLICHMEKELFFSVNQFLEQKRRVLNVNSFQEHRIQPSKALHCCNSGENPRAKYV